MTFHIYFKLFNSIKHEHEAEDLARLELEALSGSVRPISNFLTEAARKPLSEAVTTKFLGREGYVVTLGDILVHELPYGRIHGYYGKSNRLPDFGRLVRRLAYTREIIAIAEGSHSQLGLEEVFSGGVIGVNCQTSEENGRRVFRFITNQYFLEKSEYISKLSRNEKEVLMNADALLNFLTSDFYRVPATETLKVGRRLEDYFSIREEPSLYLTHYMHPYKGKFHPRMALALLNSVCPSDRGVVMDNFAGSGTLLVEASLIGLDSLGVEINPLSVLMSNVKCQCLTIPPAQLRDAVESYLTSISEASAQYDSIARGQAVLDPRMDFSAIEVVAEDIPARVANGFDDKKHTLTKIAIAKSLLAKIKKDAVREFLQLALSGAISDAFRRTKADFAEILGSRLLNLYLRVLLFHRLNEVLKIPLGSGKCIVGDTRNMKTVESGSVDGIVNSPPYSTALDYIRNDEPQLRLLGLADDLESLEDSMIGNPRHDVRIKASLSALIEGKNTSKLPPYATNIVLALAKAGRTDAGLRCLRFFEDMEKALEEMYRVLKGGGMAAVVIGNNHFLVDEEPVEIRNDDVMRRLAEAIGFELQLAVRRDLEKSSTGMIRYESVLFLRKPGRSVS